MVHFTLFGIPVYIRPSFWVVLAIFGGALSISSVEDLIYPALFVIAGFVAILSHEMGHALVGRKLGGGQQTIVLELFGGLTSSHGMQLTRGGRALMILAGPMMTLLLGIISLGLTWNIVAPVMTSYNLNFWDLAISPFTAALISPKLYILSCLIMIGEWWTILNLLPIYPLDGGQLIAQYIRSPRKVFMTGFITAILIGLLSFQLFHGYFIPHLHGPLRLQQLPGIQKRPLLILFRVSFAGPARSIQQTIQYVSANRNHPYPRPGFPEWYQQVIKAADMAENLECAAAWSSSHGATPFGNSFKRTWTSASRTPAIRTPISPPDSYLLSGKGSGACRRLRHGMRRSHPPQAGSAKG